MNTNELAEKLITNLAVLPAVIEDWGICATPYEQKKHNLSGDIAMAKNAVDEAATMLRQQQATIEQDNRLINAQQQKVVELKQALQEIIRISDRKHNAWDKAKELLK